MDITLGHTLKKPVETQKQCDAYTDMVYAVTEHNAACAIGDTLWNLDESEGGYTIVEGETLRAATAEELAAQEEARRKQAEREALPETVKALQAALEDADALNVDQEYRLTLLELGLSDETEI